MNQKIKVAIIGVGNIAESHIQGYLKNPDVELYAFCDIREERLQQMGEKYGITRLYTDKDVMLAELPEIDAVSVCTWNSAHAPCTIAALKAGKNVLCEKPMATSAAEAREMLAAAKESGKLLMIGFVRRYGNDCTILKDFVDNGYFGDIYYTKATYLRRNGSPGGWFGDKNFSAGGPLIDLGVHVTDLLHPGQPQARLCLRRDFPQARRPPRAEGQEGLCGFFLQGRGQRYLQRRGPRLRDDSL